MRKSVFFSLGLHGLLISFLLLPILKIPEKSDFAIEVQWERSLARVSLSSSENRPLSKLAVSLLRHREPSLRASRSIKAIKMDCDVGPVALLAMTKRECREFQKRSNVKNIEARTVGRKLTLSVRASSDRSLKGTEVEGLNGKKKSFFTSPSKGWWATRNDDRRNKQISGISATSLNNSNQKSYQPLPKYPWVCRKRGQEGCVALLVHTDKKGRVLSVVLHKSSGYAFLDESALSAVKSWIFPHAASQKILSFSFRLK